MGKKVCVVKNKELNIYEVKTNLKFYKIKDKILNEYNKHINGIYTFGLDMYDYYVNNEEVKLDNKYAFIEDKQFFCVGNICKMFYRGYEYPEILNSALLLRDGEVSSIDKLNEFRAPLYITNMKESRKKDKLLSDYPFDKYVDEIISCFSLKKISNMKFSNMEDLVKKIEKFTKYEDNVNVGDSHIYNTCINAEVSMFIPDDYGKVDSGISRFKNMLKKHEELFELLGGV